MYYNSERSSTRRVYFQTTSNPYFYFSGDTLVIRFLLIFAYFLVLFKNKKHLPYIIALAESEPNKKFIDENTRSIANRQNESISGSCSKTLLRLTCINLPLLNKLRHTTYIRSLYSNQQHKCIFFKTSQIRSITLAWLDKTSRFIGQIAIIWYEA